MPAPVGGAVPTHVVASRALVAAHLGAGGPAYATGGVFADRPLILEPVPATAAALPVDDGNYAIAECDADEAMTPPGCYTPVSRLLWRRGYRVRRDLYEAVLAAHAAGVVTGTETAAAPAALPPGVDQVPATMVAVTHPPVTPTTPTGT